MSFVSEIIWSTHILIITIIIIKLLSVNTPQTVVYVTILFFETNSWVTQIQRKYIYNYHRRFEKNISF